MISSRGVIYLQCTPIFECLFQQPPLQLTTAHLSYLEEHYLHLQANGKPAGSSVVAVDSVGAGVGEMVLFASGSSARQTGPTENRPVDAVVMAIVDSWEVDGKEKYRKGNDE